MKNRGLLHPGKRQGRCIRYDPGMRKYNFLIIPYVCMHAMQQSCTSWCDCVRAATMYWHVCECVHAATMYWCVCWYVVLHLQLCTSAYICVHAAGNRVPVCVIVCRLQSWASAYYCMFPRYGKRKIITVCIFYACMETIAINHAHHLDTFTPHSWPRPGSCGERAQPLRILHAFLNAHPDWIECLLESNDVWHNIMRCCAHEMHPLKWFSRATWLGTLIESPIQICQL